MSASRMVTIFCDEPSCGMWWDAGVAETAWQARRGLSGKGWRLKVPDPEGWTRALDFCPRHAKGQA